VRGGLDDALERLARRDELRRRTSPEGSTPPAVTELAEAVAAVVARHSDLAITMGVEGAGAPVLLRVAVEDGTVHIAVTSPEVTATAEPAPIVDFDFEAEDAFESEEAFEPEVPEPAPAWPDSHGYAGGSGSPWEPTTVFDPEPEPASRFDQPERFSPSVETTRVMYPQRADGYTGGAHHHGAAEHPAAFRPEQPPSPMQPPPLAEPIPFTLEPGQSEQTEQTAKRLAALLREHPSLLQD